MANTEKVLDEKMNKFLEKWLVKKIVKNDLMKQILHSSFMESIDKSLDSSWKTIMQVLWVLAIIFGVFGFFTLLFTLLSVWGLGALLGGVFSITYLLVLLLWLILSLLAVIWWWGMFKMKKWLPFVYTLSFFVTILSTLVSAAGRGGSINYLSLIITIFFWFIILKKRKTFTK